MNTLWQVLYLVLWAVRWLIIARLIVDFVRIFARRWRPAGVGAMAVEVIYTTTDPPIRALRRVLPTVRIGGVGFDLSVIVLLILLVILMSVVGRFAWTTLL
ncbi:YggT family protein [Nakamurella sp. A5-74]|uniref:YggT family protein n=1 Tax=Nakamurella sp. A5-74 TaxID=3158264 RepID=A0AAU8DM71_9ACTN